MFNVVSNKTNFPHMEKEILQLWEKEDIFKKSLENRRESREYVFYDGPPFATGLPHYGHLLAGTIKDIVPRYHTMRGHYVERRFGWDCHGLPIEALAQESLGLAGPAAIQETGIDIFNEKCRSMVLTYVEEWKKTITRMGRWVDFDDDYKTMDVNFMETIWWVFKQLWDQGRVYKAHRIMPYSWKLTTPLSNFEAGNNYKEIQDPAITVRIRTSEHVDGDPIYALAWTTTPWTLPGNLALCVGPHIDYVTVRDKRSRDLYLLAKARLEQYYKKSQEYEIVAHYKGNEISTWTYDALFPYFADQPHAFCFLMDDFVSTDEGTGIVHLAPAYGEDDYRVCREAKIDIVDPLNEECQFTDVTPEYAGQFCKDADKAIIKRLKREGKLVHQSTINHSYPFCERTDTPLIYRAINAWYVRVEDLRDLLVENNESIHWVPDYVGDKRFGNWLRDAKDWNISRNRYWGSCIPVWVAQDGSDMICVGSISELEELSSVRPTDLHKHILDQITFEKDGKVYQRTPEVLDCWFESGSMPYAQVHYPFENKERFERHFPADFIAEGLDQTRGWFYTLMVLSTALFKCSAFQNVVVNGLVLAEDGRKMSKRLKNYPDPTHVLDTYGADALRLYMIYSPIVKAEDLCFSEEGVKHALRHLLIPWWNAYSFFVTYACIDKWSPSKDVDKSCTHLLDRWILSSLERLTTDVVSAMDEYGLQSAVRPFIRFIEDLTNWYIRRSRRRFWKSANDEDKNQAYATLYEVLLRLSKIAAPFVPFISEAIYQNLRMKNMPDSVHLCDFPIGDQDRREPELEHQMETVISVVSMGRQLRTDHNLKVRQPLKGVHIVSHVDQKIEHLDELKTVISDELNIREVWLNQCEIQLATFQAKPNFKELGPRLGPSVKKAAQQIQALDRSVLERILQGQSVSISLDDKMIELTEKDLVIERIPLEGLAVASDGDLMVALETELTPELIREGLAREFVNKVQQMRKKEDLEVVQRINVFYSADNPVVEAVESHRDYIQTETLAADLAFIEKIDAEGVTWDLNGHTCSIKIQPV
ncbi:MAG: isoleucine--tRNA ligase [Kiritimatiellae bacterium]|nr:isoleucine--tRNA ligase [Kiritimatiellia bacterium]